MFHRNRLSIKLTDYRVSFTVPPSTPVYLYAHAVANSVRGLLLIGRN